MSSERAASLSMVNGWWVGWFVVDIVDGVDGVGSRKG